MKRIAIVTGASSGMGKEFAKEIFLNLHRHRFGTIDGLWIIARRKDRLEELKQSLEQAREENGIQTSAEIMPLEIDLSGKDGVSSFRAVLDAASEREPDGFEIALLVNNAGFGTYGEFSSTPLEKELDMIELNCVSLTGITGRCIPFMAKESAVINIASLAAFLPLGNFAVYAATKSYVLSFSTALAAELKDKGISVTAVCPGSVSTEFANVASNGAQKEVLHGKSAAKTVVHALKCASRKKHTALWAFKWKITAFFSRFIGRYFGARITYKYRKRPAKY